MACTEPTHEFFVCSNEYKCLLLLFRKAAANANKTRKGWGKSKKPIDHGANPNSKKDN
ncbi:hypothetical protein GCM10007111_38560 [Virgibacillus kapii]|uniref:Uncharacterized protein n=1 Tax=Virgibacillus kapii TaxID=1638645 RepID=A0ABQ2DWM3_9BACI|nr:hypothetical protein M948_05005 [Virgibacillus sp. CM-4]GGJ73232.1 hypothetical protein GCM10007111_38560 [Virgibacillus kapii]